MSGTCRAHVSVDQMHQRGRHAQILEHLREPEALHVVDERRVRRVHVVDRRVRHWRLQVHLEALERGSRAVEVLGVARDAPRVEVGLEHLGPHVVVLRAGLDEESVALVECDVAGRRARVGVVPVGREVGDGLGADARAAEGGGLSESEIQRGQGDSRGARVGVPARVVVLQREVDDRLVLEHLATCATRRTMSFLVQSDRGYTNRATSYPQSNTQGGSRRG